MIRSLGDGIWVLDHDFKMMGIPIGTRATVIRLGDGGLFLHAPGPLSLESIDAINALGPVRCIVAPNDFHHLYLEESHRAWPNADVYVSAGLPTKRPELTYAHVLGDEVPAAWAGDLEQVWMRGAPKVNEVVFFHPRSRTLILTDLAFNVTGSVPFLLRVFILINGVVGRLAISRLMKAMYRDRGSARPGAEKILAWDFDRITLCHGDVIESGAKVMLAPELARFLDS